MKALIAILVLSIALPATAAEESDRLKDAATLIFAGRTTEARAKLREAQSAYRAAKDDPHDAIASLLLGVTDVAAKDLSAARSNLDYASRKLESINDRFGAWFALMLQAQLETDNGQFAAAIALHERSLAMLRDLSDPAKPLSLDGLRMLAPLFGVPPQYSEMLSIQPLVAKMFFVPFAESMTHDNYGAALMEIGELDKADAELQRAVQSASMFGGMFDSSIRAHIGDLRRRQWRLDEARQSYMTALQSAQQIQAMPLQNDSVELSIYGKLADLEVASGRTDDALAWNDKLLARARGSHNLKREASLLQDRGNLLLRGSRFGPAEATFNDALRLAETIKDIQLQASILADLGALDLFRGAYGQSAARLEKAIALFEQVDAGYEETPVFALLAEDYVLLEAPASVADVIERGTALAKKINFPLAAALMKVVAASPQVTPEHSLTPELQAAFEEWLRMPEATALLFNDDVGNLVHSVLGGTGMPAPVNQTALPGLSAMADLAQGKSKFLSGDVAGARTLFLEGLKKNSSVDLRSGYLAGIGASYLREGNYDQAIPYFEQAVAALEATVGDIKVQEQLAGYLGSGRRWYFDLLIEMLLHKKRTAEAFHYTERARARAFLQLVGNARLNAARGDPALTAEAEQLRAQLASLQSGGAPATELEKKRKEYEGILLRVKTSNPEYASLTRVDTLGVDAIQAELPSDTTLISYFVTPFALHAWIIDRDSSAYVPLGGDREALHAALCWADDFERTGEAVRGTESLQNPCTGRRAAADEVFDLLIAPLQSRIKNQRLILVPHAQLHYIPFAALFDPVNGKYLIEEYVLSYAPSASALRFLRSKVSPGRKKALVLGDPESVDRALPGASCEAVSVSGDLGVAPLLGSRATESALHHLDGKIDLLHIAAHAAYNSANPLFSRIALAKDGEQDGNLEVHEILADLDLTGVNLIVLSACRTAVGERSGGDEIVGLTRALLYAGSPGVISTLWDISDQASAPLMEEFYRRLRAGEPAADALRAAQMSMLRDPDYSDPKYWAAFNFTGDPLVRWK
ncbi:MAG TPA: CHAT domain-containing protein [Thermoanaerobaculia bacterium]|nr:CHAT domain-containing protein [Thermoanaerobaculia bacterium]